MAADATDRNGSPSDETAEQRSLAGRLFNYANNGLTLTGMAITTVAGLSIIFFMAAGASGSLSTARRMCDSGDDQRLGVV